LPDGSLAAHWLTRSKVGSGCGTRQAHQSAERRRAAKLRLPERGSRLSFRFRQASGERVFVGGFQAQRQFLNDFDFALGRQAQHCEMFAHDLFPIRIQVMTYAGLMLATRPVAAKKSDVDTVGELDLSRVSCLYSVE
jgi:hypothetical protein